MALLVLLEARWKGSRVDLPGRIVALVLCYDSPNNSSKLLFMPAAIIPFSVTLWDSKKTSATMREGTPALESKCLCSLNKLTRHCWRVHEQPPACHLARSAWPELRSRPAQC